MDTPKILQNGAAILRTTAKPVPKELFDSPKLREVLSAMALALDTQPDGVALAAPQIGIPYRIFIVRYDRAVHTKRSASGKREAVPETTPVIGTYINPTFVRRSRKKVEMEEGCL